MAKEVKLNTRLDKFNALHEIVEKEHKCSIETFYKSVNNTITERKWLRKIDMCKTLDDLRTFVNSFFPLRLY